MTKKERLYETLGELLYAVAKADGVIQPEEKEALQKLLSKHSFSSEIKWSFEYEEAQNPSVEDIYKKVIHFCHEYGPAPEYVEFIEAMETIAKASSEIDEKELDVITSFSKDLIERFQRDIDL